MMLNAAQGSDAIPLDGSLASNREPSLFLPMEVSMSWIPCSNCRHTNGIRLRYVYSTTFEGEEKIAWRARLCPTCWESLLGDYFACADRKEESVGEWIERERRI